MKKLIVSIFIILNGFIATAQESWIVPYGSDIYDKAEELFLLEWQVPPIEETPIIADDLGDSIKKLMDREIQPDSIEKARALLSEMKLQFGHISPVLETAFYAAYNSEPGRRRLVDTQDPSAPSPTLDFNYLYDVDKVPPLLLAGMVLQAEGFSISLAPYIKASNTYLLDYQYQFNIPFDPIRINTNFPQRGIGSYFNPPVEFRFGRDKLAIGPSQWGNIGLNQNIPYYDYLKGRFFVDWFSFSFYLIQLNPTISSEESIYLSTSPDPEEMGPANGDPYIERAKFYALSRFGLTVFPWLYICVMQTNLIGGRYPWFSDINPFDIYHNNFTEGVYSVPLDVSVTVVPYRGIKLFFDFYLYDATVADESDKTKNPTAFAYQAGFTALSTPFFEIGPGRFRLDGEVTLVDPWTYGKYNDLRKFTSRIIYVESYVGRFWIDYPLGFYLGPDVVDYHLSLRYGNPGLWEAELAWQLTGKGQIDLYGWGPDNDYSNIGEPGYQVTGAPSGNVEWRSELEFSMYYVPTTGVKISTLYRMSVVSNQYNIADSNGFYHLLSVEVAWKVF
jgi:hypothetical protein